MQILTDEIKDVIAKSELVTIATSGRDGPHVVATWGAFVNDLDVDDGKTIIIPAGGYTQTEHNLRSDERVIVIVGSKQLPGRNGMGTGYRLTGRAALETEGAFFDQTKAKFPWARGALVIRVEKAEQLL